MNIRKVFQALSLFKRAFWPQRYRVVLMAVLGFLGGLMGGIGIGSIVPLFSLAVHTPMASTDIITHGITTLFAFLHLEFRLRTLLIAVAALFAVKALFVYFANYITVKITSDYERSTRRDLLKKTLAARWPYLLEQKLGHLETILLTDVSKSAGVLDQISGIILIATTLIAYSIIAVSISVEITLITLGLGIVVFFVLKPLFYKIRRESTRWAASSKAVANKVGELTVGTKTIKAAAVGADVLANIQNYFDELRRARIRIAIYGNLQSALQEPTSLLLATTIFAISYHRPDFQFASFIAVLYLVQKISAFMQSIQGRLNGMNETLPFLRSVVTFTDHAHQHHEPSGAESASVSFNHDIRFNAVHFTHLNEKEVLANITLTIQRGETVGLIGPSGSGKTTLVDLILKLFTPTSGTITVDGNNLANVDTVQWRKSIGYVSQDVFLLSGTIEENIRFFDTTISHDAIIAAAKMANIYDTIEDLPLKFGSIVGERGVKLSAGQRQRIVLARALARNPAILILDEATSALDNESEALIQSSLENLKQRMTIIIIAHRLSTVIGCDRIIAIENGKIVEEGSPNALMSNTDSYFYKSYRGDAMK